MERSLDGLVSREKLRKRFKVSDRMLRRWQKEGLKPVRIARRFYYWEDEVAQWVSANCRVNENRR